MKKSTGCSKTHIRLAVRSTCYQQTLTAQATMNYDEQCRFPTASPRPSSSTAPIKQFANQQIMAQHVLLTQLFAHATHSTTVNVSGFLACKTSATIHLQHTLGTNNLTQPPRRSPLTLNYQSATHTQTRTRLQTIAFVNKLHFQVTKSTRAFHPIQASAW